MQLVVAPPLSYACCGSWSRVLPRRKPVLWLCALADAARCEMVSAMIQCLPSSTSEKALSSPALMMLLADVDRLESHLTAAEVRHLCVSLLPP